MAEQRRRDTGIEVAVRSLLHRFGYRYRVDAPLPDLRRRADILFTTMRVAVFLDGCFWHCCPVHATWPKANAPWWKAKLAANVARDRDTDRRLRAAGWMVIRVWEHEAAEKATQRIVAALRRRATSRLQTAAAT